MTEKTKILMMAKEVMETKDSKEAALLLQSGDWVTIGAAMQGGEIVWVMARITAMSQSRSDQ